MANNSKLIIYLDRQKVILAGTGLLKPLTLDIPAGIIYDLEVIDPEGFGNLLSNWLEQNNISPAEIILVISANVYYSKGLVSTSDVATRKSHTDEFTATIPHKNLYSKEYLLADELKLIVINKDFYEPFLRFFKRSHFSIIALIPTFVLDSLKLNLVEYTPKEVAEIHKKFKLIQPYSLISPQEIEKTMSASVVQAAENKPRKITLIAVFCLLWIVLLALIFIRPRLYKPAPTPALTAKVTVNPAGPAEIPTLAPVASPSAGLANRENIRIRIVNSSGVPNQAARIRTALEAVGFQKITTTTSSKVSGAKNRIGYGTVVSQELLDIISNSVTGLAGDSSTSVADGSEDVDVLITLVSKAQ